MGKLVEVKFPKAILTEKEIEGIIEFIRNNELRSFMLGGVTADGELVSLGKAETTLDQCGIANYLLVSNTMQAIDDIEVED